ncbi:MAG: polysaccharide biosynthesis/export family protein [Candidatus Binataceae bacterium]
MAKPIALCAGFGLILVLCAGCAPTGSMRVTPTETATQLTRTTAVEAASGATSPADLEGLDKLWRQRTSSAAETNDYPIGPGDILRISVPEIAELSKTTARVGARGEITLPLLGEIRAAGLTEEQLEQELDRSLRKYMYHPQASVFVQEYRNRQVAVVGSVNKPGLVTLISPSETLIDVITRAGGLSPEAADQIVLIPAQPGNSNIAQQVVAATVLPPVDNNGKPASHAADLRLATSGETQDASASANGPEAAIEPGVAGSATAKPAADTEMSDAGAAALALMPTSAHPLIIRLKSTSLTGAGRFINMPVRPGDVIVVPGGGNVMVVGWVQHPGYFRVGSGLTVMGAIGAAGGPMYAANTTDVALIRSEAKGKVTVSVNLADIASGKEQDLPVKANDVIDVPYSGVRIGPYIFYQIISRMGVMGPAVPF